MVLIQQDTASLTFTPRNNRLRVLFLTDHLDLPHGGTEQHLAWLLEKLPGANIEKHFAVISTVERTDLSTWPVPGTLFASANACVRRTWWQRVKATQDYIRQHQIEVVHTLCPLSELVAVCATAGGRTAKVIGSRRNSGYALKRMGALRSRLLGRFVSHYVANSTAAKQVAISREKIPPEQVTVIPNPVRTDRIEAGRNNGPVRQEVAADDELIVAMVATVRPIKDYPTFLHAARTVLERCPHVRFLAIGDHSSQITELKALATELGIADQLTWYGGVENPLAILKHADVAVLTSRSESFSNAVLEYAASGIPAVVTNVGDLRLIVLDNESGYVVPPDSPEEVADRIMKLLADSTRRQAFGERAKAHVLEHYSEERVISQYLDVYQTLRR